MIRSSMDWTPQRMKMSLKKLKRKEKKCKTSIRQCLKFQLLFKLNL